MAGDQLGPYLLLDGLVVHRRVAAPPGLVAQLGEVVTHHLQPLRATDGAVAWDDHVRPLGRQALHHGEPSQARHVDVDVDRWEPREDRELPGLGEIPSEHQPVVGNPHHLVAVGVSPAGRAHRHHPAAEVELVGVVVDDVRLAELDTAQLRGHGVPEVGEHLDVAGALPGPVLGLGPVDQVGRPAAEGLRAERVLGVEVGRRQEDPPAPRVLVGEGQHGLPVDRAHAGLDDGCGERSR